MPKICWGVGFVGVWDALPSRIDQLSDSENDFDIEEDDSSSALGNSSFYIEFFSTKICPRYAKICFPGGWVCWGLGCPAIENRSIV